MGMKEVDKTKNDKNQTSEAVESRMNSYTFNKLLLKRVRACKAFEGKGLQQRHMAKFLQCVSSAFSDYLADSEYSRLYFPGMGVFIKHFNRRLTCNHLLKYRNLKLRDPDSYSDYWYVSFRSSVRCKKVLHALPEETEQIK